MTWTPADPLRLLTADDRLVLLIESLGRYGNGAPGSRVGLDAVTASVDYQLP